MYICACMLVTAADSSQHSSSNTHPAPEVDGRPRRKRTAHRVPRKFRDLVPEPLQPAANRITRILLRVTQPLTTVANAFGLFRVFAREPTHDPDPKALLDVLDNADPSSEAPDLGVYPNKTAAMFNQWFWNGGGTKTRDDRQSLVDVILSPDFVAEDLRGINWQKLDEQVSAAQPVPGASWCTTDLRILLPAGRNAAPVPVTVPGFSYRPLIDMFRNDLATDPAVKTFQWEEHTLMVQPEDPGGEPKAIYCETYSSQRFRDACREIQRLPRPAGDDMPYVVLGLMPASDSTHLSSFGNASTWPAYMMYSNQSKYLKAKPKAHAIHHFASFQKVCLCTVQYAMA